MLTLHFASRTKMLNCSIKKPYTVKSVLRGHHWDQEKVAS